MSQVCVETRHFAVALPILEVPISVVDTSISDLHYSDNLVYHYAGGIALAALKRWREAEDYFEICATAPGHTVAALQLEAFQKLTLVQLILYGEVCTSLGTRDNSSPLQRLPHRRNTRTKCCSVYSEHLHMRALRRHIRQISLFFKAL